MSAPYCPRCGTILGTGGCPNALCSVNGATKAHISIPIPHTTASNAHDVGAELVRLHVEIARLRTIMAAGDALADAIDETLLGRLLSGRPRLRAALAAYRKVAGGREG